MNALSPQTLFVRSKTALLAGALALGLGFIVMAGWFTHTTALLRLHEGWVAMAFNTSVGFILGGLGLILLNTRRPALAAVPGGFLFLLFGATFLEYLFDADFGIDQAVVKAYVISGIVQNGRMAINTALCGMLTGVYLVLNAFPTSNDRSVFAWRRPAVSGLIGAVVLGLAAVGLTAYLSDVASAYQWGKLARMAVHTVIGYVVLGTGLIARAWHEDRLRYAHQRAPRWLPLLVGMGTATSALCMWQILSVEQNAHADALRKLAASVPRTNSVPFDALAREREIIPIAVLVSGLALGSALTLAVYFAQTARHHAALVDQSNLSLQGEISQRETAEHERQTALDDLQKVNSALESRVRVRTDDLETVNLFLRDEMEHRDKAEVENARLLKEVARVALYQKAFLRDVLQSVTEGHLRLCDAPGDLPPRLPQLITQEPVWLTPSTLHKLRFQTREAARERGFSETRVSDLLTAVGEASMNAVVHGSKNAAPGDEPARAEVWGSETALQIWVTDHGKGIAWDSLHRATLERGYTTASSLGHGFWLMLKTCDRVYLLTGAGGTTVVLEQDCEPSGPSWLDDGM